MPNKSRPHTNGLGGAMYRGALLFFKGDKTRRLVYGFPEKLPMMRSYLPPARVTPPFHDYSTAALLAGTAGTTAAVAPTAFSFCTYFLDFSANQQGNAGGAKASNHKVYNHAAQQQISFTFYINSRATWKTRNDAPYAIQVCIPSVASVHFVECIS